MPFGIGRALEPREFRLLVAGATVVALAAVGVPYVRHWNARADVIAVARERLARLTSIAGKESELRALVAAQDARLDAAGVRLLRARTPALASSALQSLVQDYARASGVSVTRLDAAGAPDAAPGATLAVPATISATGDIYGIAAFLRSLQHGTTLLDVSEVSIAPNPTLRGNLLQLSVTVRAPIATED